MGKVGEGLKRALEVGGILVGQIRMVVWCGVVGGRARDWRNGSTSVSVKSVELLAWGADRPSEWSERVAQILDKNGIGEDDTGNRER